MKSLTPLAVACMMLSIPTFCRGLDVGAAKRVITPDPLLPNPTTRKLGDLMARAVVAGNEGPQVAIVSLDVLGFPRVLGDKVRQLVPRMAAETILIAATHTHSAPDCYAFPDGQGGHTGDLAYIDFVCRQAAAAVNEAIDNMQPATLRIATGEAQGKIAYNYYAPDLYDRRMSVIQADHRETGRPIVTLVNYAVHPEVLGSDQGIVSPDLVGPLCEALEAQPGGIGMFVNGAQGGMVTADNRKLDAPTDPVRGYWADERSWQECVRIGTTMASEARRILATASDQPDARVAVRSTLVRFPVDSDLLWGVVQGSPLRYPVGPGRAVETRIVFVSLGDAQILTIPGEALPNIGFYLKRKMGGKNGNNLLFGLTNDAFGYILTPRYRYISRTSLGEQTGPIYLKAALGLLQ